MLLASRVPVGVRRRLAWQLRSAWAGKPTTPQTSTCCNWLSNNLALLRCQICRKAGSGPANSISSSKSCAMIAAALLWTTPGQIHLPDPLTYWPASPSLQRSIIETVTFTLK